MPEIVSRFLTMLADILTQTTEKEVQSTAPNQLDFADDVYCIADVFERFISCRTYYDGVYTNTKKSMKSGRFCSAIQSVSTKRDGYSKLYEKGCIDIHRKQVVFVGKDGVIIAVAVDTHSQD